MTSVWHAAIDNNSCSPKTLANSSVPSRTYSFDQFYHLLSWLQLMLIVLFFECTEEVCYAHSAEYVSALYCELELCGHN